MPDTIYFVAFGVSLIFSIFTSMVAKHKGYDTSSWGVAGFLFSFIALLAIIGMPTRNRLGVKIERKANGSWDCVYCGHTNAPNEDRKCTARTCQRFAGFT